jgi:hypothetical protein
VGSKTQATGEALREPEWDSWYATAVIKGLRHANIPYQVAPYEADLYIVKHIDAVLTLDSDLVTYGVKKLSFLSKKSRTHNFKTGEMGVFDFDSCLKAPPSLTHSLTHSPTHSLTHSLTNSLTYLLNQCHDYVCIFISYVSTILFQYTR